MCMCMACVCVVCVQKMSTGADLVANYEGIPFMTSAGPCVAKTLTGAHIG
jgi:hypothetical protein